MLWITAQHTHSHPSHTVVLQQEEEMAFQCIIWGQAILFSGAQPTLCAPLMHSDYLVKPHSHRVAPVNPSLIVTDQLRPLTCLQTVYVWVLLSLGRTLRGQKKKKKEQDIEAFFSQHFQDPKRNRVSVPLPTARKVGGSFAQATKVFCAVHSNPAKWTAVPVGRSCWLRRRQHISIFILLGLWFMRPGRVTRPVEVFSVLLQVCSRPLWGLRHA